MCGLVGYVNFTKDISGYNHIIKDMNNALKKRGPDEDGYFIDKNVNLAHKRLIVIDPEKGSQPMQAVYNENIYTIVYNGQIYNALELRKELIDLGFTFERSLRYRGLT